MTTQPREIGSINASPQDKITLATRSKTWICKSCGTNHGELHALSNLQDNINSKINNNLAL